MIFQGATPTGSPSHSRKASEGNTPAKGATSAPAVVANGFVNDAQSLSQPLFHKKTKVCVLI